ncbi:hypothetical protein HK096_001495, partial [Nowakowskiella sp. JEL0078]
GVSLLYLVPSVDSVIYITRSTQKDENETVITEILERFGEDWELSCVLPNIEADQQLDYEFEEILKIHPDESGNGIFVSYFQKKIHPTINNETIEHEERQKNIDVLNSDYNKEFSKPKTKISTKRISKHKILDSKEKKSKKVVRVEKKKLSKKTVEAIDYLVSKQNPLKIQRRKSEPKINNYETEFDSSNTESDENVIGISEKKIRQEKIKKKKKNFMESDELEVMGLSVSTFYAPQIEALKQITSTGGQIPKEFNGKEILTGTRGDYSSLKNYIFQTKWKYPVPNPRPWK